MTDDPFYEALADGLAKLSPSDTVPRSGISRETVLYFNEAAGREVQMTEPGDVILDGDDLPVGMTQPTTTTATLANLTISQADADRLGLTQREIPNVHII